MFTAIVTWAGAMLGVTVLLLMAFGQVANDFDTPRVRRHREPVEKG
ncbi:MAG: hypothetical protein ACRDQF_04805 [Thermocrispum sp.]